MRVTRASQAPHSRTKVQPVDCEIPGVEQAGSHVGDVGEGAGTGSDLGVDTANLSFGNASQHVPTVAESQRSEQDVLPSGLGGHDPGPAHTMNAPMANDQSHNDQLAKDFAPDTPPLRQSSHVPILDTTLKFINILQSEPSASDKKLDDKTQSRLQHPTTSVPVLSPDEHLSLRLFLADTNGSERIYKEVCAAIVERFPECKPLSLHLVRKKVAELTGVVSILEDMCPGSCIVYTGPYAALDACPHCGLSRYDLTLAVHKVKKAHQQFNTFPIGPQIQA
ncbi:hypothetical protein C8Q72DRAFT_916601 [Fomitopsis betulina]|nr:hypothetical protein C8Q72DRAFT_916601 [Fomitopsis betulina]